MTTILLTGASRGIGAAAREALEARGCRVIGQATRAETGIIAADFADPQAPQALWESALEMAGGRIDVLVNNAGLFAANPLDSSDIAWLDGWEDTLRINLTSAAQLSRFAVRHWQADGREGRVVHVASRAGQGGRQTLKKKLRPTGGSTGHHLGDSHQNIRRCMIVRP